jgi:hypothetical protein
LAITVYNPPEEMEEFKWKDFICLICKKECNGKDGFIGQKDGKVCISCYFKARESG